MKNLEKRNIRIEGLSMLWSTDSNCYNQAKNDDENEPYIPLNLCLSLISEESTEEKFKHACRVQTVMAGRH